MSASPLSLATIIVSIAKKLAGRPCEANRGGHPHCGATSAPYRPARDHARHSFCGPHTCRWLYACDLVRDGNSIWVANYNNGTVTQLSVNGQALQTIATGNNPNSIAFDGVNLWVTYWGSNTLTQIRASDGAVLGNLPTGLNPAGVLFDGSHIWVANSGSNRF
jgi:hypothetical protein